MKKRGKYTLKTYSDFLYSWTPDENISKLGSPVAQYYCDATPFSQGQDWISTYSYDVSVVDGVQKRSAYVACDYVN